MQTNRDIYAEMEKEIRNPGKDNKIIHTCTFFRFFIKIFIVAACCINPLRIKFLYEPFCWTDSKH